MLRIGLLGAGRIAQVHARAVNSSERTVLTSVFDPNDDAAERLARRYGAVAVSNPQAVWEDDQVDAVIVGSPTDTHIEFTRAAVEAGKPVLCEKPICRDLDAAEEITAELSKYNVPVQIGFMRRHDPSFRDLQNAIQAGELGDIRQIFITNRDPKPHPLEYFKTSGGIFRDCTIHDFDMARFLLNHEEIDSVFADGSCMVDPAIGEIGDYDTALTILKTKSGRTVTINNCRQASYGNDQRIEAFGSKGMLIADNMRPSTLSRYLADATDVKDPLLHFFPERYEKASVAQIDSFAATILDGAPVAVTFEDGVYASRLAEAAIESAATGKLVQIESKPKATFRA